MADGAEAVVAVACEIGNEYDGRMGLRISSVFVIGFGSLLGALLPVMAARSRRMRVPPLAFFITKYFGSGVIISTAFIHLLAPAVDALMAECLTGPITEYPWVEGICLMTIFTMFFIELMAARYEFFGSRDKQDVERFDPSFRILGDRGHANRFGSHNHQRGADPTSQAANMNLDAVKESESSTGEANSKSGPRNSSIPGRPDDFSYPPGGEDHLGHHRDHSYDDDHFAAQMTSIFILEFGVIFHSIFIGLTLAVTGEEFNVLYIVIAFHQTFEGLGLGSRLATAPWPKSKAWMPWALGTAYGLTTPIAIAVGLGVRTSFSPGSQTTLIVNGVFDSISAGILIYTGLVELMAHEFMFNPEMRRSSMKMMLFAYFCMCLGAGLMSLLGKWA